MEPAIKDIMKEQPGRWGGGVSKTAVYHKSKVSEKKSQI